MVKSSGHFSRERRGEGQPEKTKERWGKKKPIKG